MPRILIVFLLFAFSTGAMADPGLIEQPSPYSVSKTMIRIESTVRQAGLTVFAVIDHAKGARQVGQKLRPTQLIIFGNPKGGTPLMQCSQKTGIDLPLKILVWENAQGKVMLGYNDPVWIARRHQVPNCPVAQKLHDNLAKLVSRALQPDATTVR